MQINRYLWIKNKRYYMFDRFATFKEALNIAKQKKEENEKNKYFILCVEVSGLLTKPQKVYVLYCTHFMTLI